MTADASFLTSSPPLRLRGPVDLVVAVPYLLGFVPERSVVVVTLDDDAQVVLVARVDLPDLSGVEAGGSAGALAELAADMGAQVGGIAVRSGGCRAVAVLYPSPTDPAEPPGPTAAWRHFAAELTEALGPVELVDCLLVHERRWWSLVCRGEPCCPTVGRQLPPAGTTEAEAAAVVAGLSVLPGRQDVGRLLAPASPERRQPVEDLLRAGPPPGRLSDSGQRAAALALVDGLLADRCRWPDTQLTPTAAAAALRALVDSTVRDASLRCPAPPEGEAAVALWTELVRLAPTSWLADPAALLAAASYQQGHGILAGFAAEAALADDPSHVLAGQLLRALELGIAPKELLAVFDAASTAARAAVTGMS